MPAPELEIDFDPSDEPQRLYEELEDNDEAFAVLRTLRAIDTGSKKDIAEECGVEPRKVKHRLNKKLQPPGLVEVVTKSPNPGAANPSHIWGLTDLGERWTEQFREKLLSGEFRAAPGPMLADLLDDVEELRQLTEATQKSSGQAHNDIAGLQEQLDDLHDTVDELRIEIEDARRRDENPDGVDLPTGEFDSLGDRLAQVEGLTGGLYLTLHEEIEDVRDLVDEAREAAADSVSTRVDHLSEEMDIIRANISDLEPTVNRLDEQLDAARKFSPPQRAQVEWDSLRDRLKEMHRVLEEQAYDYEAGDRR